jgi:hypothetical protein
MSETSWQEPTSCSHGPRTDSSVTPSSSAWPLPGLVRRLPFNSTQAPFVQLWPWRGGWSVGARQQEESQHLQPGLVLRHDGLDSGKAGPVGNLCKGDALLPADGANPALHHRLVPRLGLRQDATDGWGGVGGVVRGRLRVDPCPSVDCLSSR